MPGVLAFPARAEFCVLETSAARPIGVFLVAGGDVQFRLLDAWDGFDDPEYLECLQQDFTQKLHEMGGQRFLAWMEDTFSNFLRISDRSPARGKSLDDLYFDHVDSSLSLPVYSLQAAATKFGEDSEVEAIGSVKVTGLRSAEGMFVARVVGRSMEPLIPDGSMCIFRAPVIGSRQGKRLLIEQFGISDSSARYTVKRYNSLKTHTSEDEWEHANIRLEPLNPEFPAFDLDGERFRVIAEFVRVL